MKRIALAALIALALSSCHDGQLDTSRAAAPVSATDLEVRTLLEQFKKPENDVRELTLKLHPTDADYAEVFEGAAADKAKEGYTRAWASGRLRIGGTGEQTELQIFHATTEDFRSNAAPAKSFPNGYARVAAQLKPGLTIYGFKFVKPGETTGTNYDGLIFVNGHWALFPKPFHFLR